VTRAVGIAVLVAVALGSAAPARAAGELEVAVAGGGASLFELDDVAPGMRGEERVTLTNNSGDAGDVAVRVVDLVEDDNGCNRPEQRAGDSTCGVGGGELGRDLTITVTDEQGDELYSGSLRSLAGGVRLDSTLGAGATADLTFEYVFEQSSGNETQTDRVGFDVEVTLAQAGAASVSDVAGMAFGSGPTARIAGAELPRTGGDAMPLVNVAVTCLLAGAGAVWIGRGLRGRGASSASETGRAPARVGPGAA
jgi:hypothetical protein